MFKGGQIPVRITGKIVGASIDFKTNKPTLTLEVNGGWVRSPL